MESALYGVYALVVLYQKSHSFAALTRSISDTSTTRALTPYARTFHEVIYISSLVRILMTSFPSFSRLFMQTVGEKWRAIDLSI